MNRHSNAFNELLSIKSEKNINFSRIKVQANANPMIWKVEYPIWIAFSNKDLTIFHPPKDPFISKFIAFSQSFNKEKMHFYWGKMRWFFLLAKVMPVKKCGIFHLFFRSQKLPIWKKKRYGTSSLSWKDRPFTFRFPDIWL